MTTYIVVIEGSRGGSVSSRRMTAQQIAEYVMGNHISGLRWKQPQGHLLIQHTPPYMIGLGQDQKAGWLMQYFDLPMDCPCFFVQPSLLTRR